MSEGPADDDGDGEPAPERTTAGDAGGRTDEEQRVVDAVARRRGEQWAADHAELILAQARLVGELGSGGE